ncbi:MAG: purine-nucleoside phosphorylase, partial [Bacilli bacterium]|nr:purine-nucleoside phosphorylase [Bacilli bacterium]
NFYGVKVIVRAGTCGAWQPNIKLFDLLIAEDAITNSSWARLHGLDDEAALRGDPEMLEYAKQAADEIGVNHFEGRIYTSDVFYGQKSLGTEKYCKQGVLGVEMETFALYQLAHEHHIKALSILTVSDSLFYKEELTSDQRSKMRKMVEIGISILEKYA